MKPAEREATLNVLFLAFVPLRTGVLNVRLLLKMCLGGKGEGQRTVKMQIKVGAGKLRTCADKV